MTNIFALINDQLVPERSAALGIGDLAIQRGYGIFDFFKTIHHRPVFLDHHLNRFFHSAERLHLPIGKTRSELTALITTLMDANKIPDSGIRMTLTGGYSEDGYALGQPNLVITQRPLQLPNAETFQKGIRLLTYPHQRQMPDTKTIDYLMAIWLQPLIKEQDADDVLYYNDNIITECPRSNIFIVTPNNTVVTPSRNILRGVIRMKTLECSAAQYKTEQRDITLEEIRAAKEAFITSTTRHLVPVLQLDGKPIGNGQPGIVTGRLNEQLGDLAKNENPY